MLDTITNRLLWGMSALSLAPTGMSWATAADETLSLANRYHAGVVCSEYWLSEKFDGIRALWTGTQLVTRHGKVIAAPAWFTQSLPSHQKVEGELWAGRGNFHHVQQTVLDHQPDDESWRNIRWMVFDMPDEPGDYLTRFARLNHWLHTVDQPFIQSISYQPCVNESKLMHYLETVEAMGGEGVMLRRIRDTYQIGRSDSLLKLKSYQDAEATVIGYKPGKGRLRGLVGALKVRSSEGRVFFIGSGLDDHQRQTPPAVGSQVTYRFNGVTASGKPRFPRFLRQKISGY